jgi:hypothetical protein
MHESSAGSPEPIGRVVMEAFRQGTAFPTCECAGEARLLFLAHMLRKQDWMRRWLPPVAQGVASPLDLIGWHHPLQSTVGKLRAAGSMRPAGKAEAAMSMIAMGAAIARREVWPEQSGHVIMRCDARLVHDGGSDLTCLRLGFSPGAFRDRWRTALGFSRGTDAFAVETLGLMGAERDVPLMRQFSSLVLYLGVIRTTLGALDRTAPDLVLNLARQRPGGALDEKTIGYVLSCAKRARAGALTGETIREVLNLPRPQGAITTDLPRSWWSRAWRFMTD